jgi:hypothetical protein
VLAAASVRAARFAQYILTFKIACNASLAQLAEHALRKRMVVGSIPTGGLVSRMMLHVSFHVEAWIGPPRARA